MPRYVVALAAIVAVFIGGIRIVILWNLATSYPWQEGIVVIGDFLDVVEMRFRAIYPMSIYLIGCLLAGVVEGYYWRIGQLWSGYHRFLAELSYAPLFIGFSLILNWGFAINPQPLLTLWLACLFFGVFGWCLSAGYKAASVR